jgi:hypothetical protein
VRDGLDALGDDLHPQAAGHVDDRLDDRARVLGVLAVEVGHEGAVDLEHVDREAPDVGQRAVAGAEVVEDERDAQAAQRVERRDARVGLSMIALSVISARSAVGSTPVSAMIRSKRSTRPDVKTCLAERLNEIGRTGRPGPRRPTRPTGGRRRGTPTRRARRSGRSPRRRDELAGRDEPALGVLPADERLDRDHPPVSSSTIGW